MNTERSLRLKRLVVSALCLAIALVLPFLTGQLKQLGNMLCPMHLPVLLCGFVCGWPWGLAVGIIAPIMRSLIFQMPQMVSAIPMAVELAVYGASTGLLYKLLPKKIPFIYVNLLCSMVAGRVVWGVFSAVMAGVRSTPFGLEMFFTQAVVNAVPGMILQIVLIPVLVMVLRRGKLMLNE
ncbi:MAG: ECF transporter S component [Ruminococcaceae bacterium]|nr:ECF transporter S component [Oscillospiraceae bacterium]